jgi:hypothetical protein
LVIGDWGAVRTSVLVGRSVPDRRIEKVIV